MEIFTYKEISIEFGRIGHGSQKILAFHGFGRHCSDFGVFEKILSPDQQIIAFNLFAHGNSFFPQDRIDKLPLTKSEWLDILNAFLSAYKIEKFHLLGYSMGGRICMTTIELMPEKIMGFLLIAPDGLKINWLYRFASNTALGRKIYRSIIEKPKWFFRLAAILNYIKIINDKLHRFVHVHLDTREKRQQVHDAWLIYKNTFPDLDIVGQNIRKYDHKGVLIFGKFDSVIKPKLAERLMKRGGRNISLHIIDAGHKLLTAFTIDYIEKNKLWF